MRIKYPDFTNSLVNLASSIKKHFNGGPNYDYPSIKIVDDIIKDKNKVVVILLDGMGINIINGNLDEDSFIRKHLVHEMTSIFPPTTVAATNAFLKGCLPGENGWFGWQQYFKENNHHIIMFKDEDYYTGEAVDPQVKNKYVLNDDFGNHLNVKYYGLYPAFRPNGYATFKDEVDAIIDITKAEEKSFTYAYWDYPDALIHEYGCYNAVIKANLLNLSVELERLEKEKSDDSVILVIADHGLVDVSGIDLKYYPEVNKYYTILPSLEGRACVFYVDDKKGFKDAFNKEFSKWFDLYETDEFLKLNLVGNKNEKVLPFLGDYISIAKDKYYFLDSSGNSELGLLKGHHAGITEDEMMIPLIVIN